MKATGLHELPPVAATVQEPPTLGEAGGVLVKLIVCGLRGVDTSSTSLLFESAM